MKIMMVRHGETAWNAEGRFQGKTDTPLSLRGEQQAENTALALRHQKIDAIYTSPLSRAMSTARKIAAFHDLPFIVDDRLTEIDFGEWDGHTHQEIARLWPEQYRKFMECPYHAEFPGEGSMENGYDRAHSFTQEIVEKYGESDQTVLLVGSSSILKLCIFSLLQMDISMFEKIEIKNAAVTTLRRSASDFVLETLNA